MQNVSSVGPACRAGLRGHAATSEESRSKGRPRGDVERMCDLWRFALRRKSFPAERTYFNNHPRLHPARQINKKLPRSSRFHRNQNAELVNLTSVAGTPKHSTTSEKGESMPLIDSLDANQIDWPEPVTVTCTIPINVNSRLSSTWPDDDFLCWSSRQKDAEIIVEYDV